LNYVLVLMAAYFTHCT